MSQVETPLTVIKVGKFVIVALGMVLMLVCVVFNVLFLKRTSNEPEISVVTETTPLINS